MNAPLCEYDAPPVHQTFFDPTATGQPAGAIVNALTTVRDCPPTAVTPLSEAVDVDAVSKLLDHAATSVPDPAAIALEFAVDGWVVVVTGNGAVQVYDGDDIDAVVELESER